MHTTAVRSSACRSCIDSLAFQNVFVKQSVMSDAATPSGEAHIVDKGDTVDVLVHVPQGTSEGDVTVSGGADALQVQLKDAPRPLLSVLQLYSTVDPMLTQGRIDDGSQLVISLHKRDASLAWPGLDAVREEPEAQQVLMLPLAVAPMHACCRRMSDQAYGHASDAHMP